MANELRQISESELQEILNKHEEWLESKQTKGEQADLIEANLSYTDPTGADLRKANLTGANLIEADLTGANLRGANLRGAYLIEADLRETDLFEADLKGANLRGANLSEVNLSEVNLSEVNLSEAHLWNTIFADVDLREVKRLETVKHRGPSTIGLDTIYRSQGKIPEVFLRGCGVPDNFIEYMHSLTGSAIEFYSCFISYSSKDEDFAQRLHADLQQKGVRCWFAPEDMKIGDKIRQTITDSIRVHDKLLLILSDNSVESEWVEDEVEDALEQEKKRNGKPNVLFPVRIDDTVMNTNHAFAAKIRRTRHIGDFTNWKNHDSYQKGFDRLLRDLKA